MGLRVSVGSDAHRNAGERATHLCQGKGWGWENRGICGLYIAALDQPQLAKSDGKGSAGEAKTVAMDLPAPVHLASQRLTCQVVWDLQRAGRNEAEGQGNEEATGHLPHLTLGYISFADHPYG